VKVVPREAAGARLDRFLAGATGVSRAELQRWIEAGRVTVDGVVRDAGTRVREGERVEALPMARAASAAAPEAGVVFDVLYADDDLVLVNKPPGLVVHPAKGHEGGTLVNGLLALGYFRREDLADERPGIVHRLDKGTSGVMVVARTPVAREALKAQFAAHTIDREYVAICAGLAKTQAHRTLHGRDPRNRLRFTSRVRALGAGKVAVTHIACLEALAGGAASLVRATLETGRTHQIRMHLSEAGTPILGDALYGKRATDARVEKIAQALGHQALHARVLGFVHPVTRVTMRFEAPPPEDFAGALAALRLLR